MVLSGWCDPVGCPTHASFQIPEPPAESDWSASARTVGCYCSRTQAVANGAGNYSVRDFLRQLSVTRSLRFSPTCFRIEAQLFASGCQIGEPGSSPGDRICEPPLQPNDYSDVPNSDWAVCPCRRWGYGRIRWALSDLGTEAIFALGGAMSALGSDDDEAAERLFL
jgi:hypothetical protein